MEYARQTRRRRKRWPIGLTILIDILLTGACLVVFALFDHVLPKAKISVPPMLLPKLSGNPHVSDEFMDDPSIGDFSEKFADKFTDGEVIVTDNSYQSANLNVTVTRYDTVRKERKLVYYVEDIYIRHIDCLRTLFAHDTFGKAIVENVEHMSERVNAIAAINSDYYGCVDDGIVIRNGVLYRDRLDTDEEVLILYRDGTMKVFQDPRTLDVDQALEAGAWQGFSFGPSLMDAYGQRRKDLDSVAGRGGRHPRTMIGMVEPGHYMFITVDGRRPEYSDGATLTACGQICEKLGLTVAYNLDGGNTAQMTFMETFANDPSGDGRRTSDIIYIADLDGGEGA